MLTSRGRRRTPTAIQRRQHLAIRQARSRRRRSPGRGDRSQRQSACRSSDSANGQITRIVEPSGRALTLTYVGGRISQVSRSDRTHRPIRLRQREAARNRHGCGAARARDSPAAAGDWDRTGFARKSIAPSFMAATASSMLPDAVITMTGMSASISFVARSTPKPSRLQGGGDRRGQPPAAPAGGSGRLQAGRGPRGRCDPAAPAHAAAWSGAESLSSTRRICAFSGASREGTPARRASSSISTMSLLPFSISAVTRPGARRLFFCRLSAYPLRALRRIVPSDEVSGQGIDSDCAARHGTTGCARSRRGPR